MHAKTSKSIILFLLRLCSCLVQIIANDNFVHFNSERLASDYTSGCRIANLDLFSEDVMKFFRKEPDLFCDTRVVDETNTIIRPPLFTESTRFLYFNGSALRFYEIEQFECYYYSFEREEGAYDNVRYARAKPLQTHQPNEIFDEFIRVTCIDAKNGQIFYEDFFAFLPLKPATENRCNKANKNEFADQKSLNVLVIGLDTMSRLQFHRQFPRSSVFLKERMHAIEMMGYNKVAENTYPNLVPLLSGLTAEQLDNVCLRANGRLADTCPLIWKDHHQRGFRTIFMEDGPNWAIFNYGARGFQYQPTDYYARPIFLQYEHVVGHDDIGCGSRCLGSRSSFSFLLNYAEKTARTFRDKKYFGFYWSCSATHDTFNIPTQVDETLEKFLSTLTGENLLNNTLLIVMADHGPRIPEKSAFFYTTQGQCEKRLPLLMLVFPDWFKKKYTEAVANLQKNAFTLTSHFDLYRVFLDVMNLASLETPILQKRYREDKEPGQGRSLFLPISPNRTCYHASIPAEHCACDCTNLQPLTSPAEDDGWFQWIINRIKSWF